LSESGAVPFLRFNLKQTLEGLTQGRPASLVADEVRTEQASQMRSHEDALMDIALEHAGLIVELANTVRIALEAAQVGRQNEVAAMAGAGQGSGDGADRELNGARGSLLEDDNFSATCALNA